MVEGRFIGRGVVATLLSPLVCGFVVALVLTIGMFFFLPEGLELPDGPGQTFVNLVFYFWLLMAFFGAPFIIVATLITQIPLTILHRRRGRRVLWLHLAASAAAAILLFLLLAPALIGLTFTRSFDPLNEEILISLAHIGVGGVSVGLLWDWLVLKPMFKGG